MAEQNEVKKELTPEQLTDRNLHREATKMPNQKMSRRINRLARESTNNMDATWAIVLSLIFDSTKPQGRMEPYLR